MNTSYSNKALPPGTVLREWRLEEVLGVGGFGIVYKGRGIYFDELVAIKEYFPSAISERKDGDTVVPIDSDSEEVHALGLKKFVEEAKLLWNLSTPTRHPNIVSVRSLFEIHGTAYIVMDFEDGVSLSRHLKDGRRFNEASLMALIKPIAEGLERAHRVGVLHRDIKPPNILVNLDGRPVLIDFGSARFESGAATSTKVTFHTPPYAAIEQYVKTFPQGPWTDIYALSVVLYECVTGEKPPEVLERMHGGLGRPLAEGEWPGYSRSFLKAIDAGMTIRPAERPQSISAWLALFDATEDATTAADDEDDDATRFVSFQPLPETIVPVAPPPPGFGGIDKVATQVPQDPSEVQFKIAGQETNAAKMGLAPPPQSAPPQPAAAVAPKPAQPTPTDIPENAAMPQAPKSATKAQGPKRPVFVASVATAVAGVAALGWYLAGQDAPTRIAASVPFLAPDTLESAAPSDGVAGDPTAVGSLAQAVQSLAADARKTGAPGAAVDRLALQGAKLASLSADLQGLAGDAAATRNNEIAALAQSAGASFSSALLSGAEFRAQKLGRDQPWADPRHGNAAQGEVAERQKVAASIRQAWNQLHASAATAGNASGPAQSIAAARQALVAFGSFSAVTAKAYRNVATEQSPSNVAESAAVAEASPAPPVPETITATASAVSPRKLREFNAAVASARELAAKVIRAGDKTSRPGSNASDDEKSRYRLVQQNTKTAQGYLQYLDVLASSMRGAKGDREADQFIAKAIQTKSYLLVLQSR